MKVITSEDGQVIATDASLDEIFIAMQPTEKDRAEAREFIERNPRQ